MSQAETPTDIQGVETPTPKRKFVTNPNHKPSKQATSFTERVRETAQDSDLVSGSLGIGFDEAWLGQLSWKL